MNKKILFLSAIFSIALCSCGEEIQGTWKSIVASQENIITQYNNTVPPFNTVMNLNYFLYDENESSNQQTLDTVTSLYNEQVTRLHKIFDRHYYYTFDPHYSSLVTNIKTINDSYGTGNPVHCSDELYSLLKTSVQGYELTNGYFNIFTGSLTDYWNKIFDDVYNYMGTVEELDPYFNEEKRNELELIVSSIPSSIEEVKQQLTFDDEKKSVTFNKLDKNIVRPYISVGGVAKGMATDIIKNMFIEKGYIDGYLISGGSSISTLSKPIYTGKEKGQKISVINPATSNVIEKNVAFSMRFKEEFNFSTSGNYTTGKSYAFINDKGNIIYRHHIINPFTGYPESYYRSVSVSTSYFSNAMVDILSTAFMNTTIEEGIAIRAKINELYPNNDLNVFYLKQQGSNAEAKLSIYATSNMNDTFMVQKGIDVTYEE